MLRTLLGVSSGVNVAGGAGLLLLVLTGVTYDPGHSAPIIAIIVGGILLAQGGYSLGYALEWWKSWRSMASGALLGGQLVALCAGILTTWYAVFYVPRAANGGIEPGPFISGAAIIVNALLALGFLAWSGALTPKTRGRAAA